MASTAGLAPATSTFARWRSDLTELRGQLALSQMASVIGLAPIWLPKPCESDAHKKRPLREKQWPDLKGRLRELLCIHGLLA